MLRCRRHSQAKQVLNGIAQNDQRRQDNRNGTPPAQRRIDQHILPEHLMDARLAKPTFRGFRQSKDEKPNISVEVNASRWSFRTTSLTGHRHDLPQKRSVKRTGFLAFRWDARVSPTQRISQTGPDRICRFFAMVLRLPTSPFLSSCSRNDNKWPEAPL